MQTDNNGTDVSMLENDDFLFSLRDLAIAAGAEAVRLRDLGLVTEYKDDNSPVTNADIEANHIMCSGLQAFTPDIPIISEENKTDWPSIAALKTGYYWLIDPIDGTKPFKVGGDEFTVNIALMKDERPVLGVIDAPKMDGGMTYMGVCDGGNKRAYKQPHGGDVQTIQTKTSKAANDIDVIMSKRAYKGDDTLPSGFSTPNHMSSSYKFCVVANGTYDAVAGFGPTSEWDIAAGHAIVKAAGGDVVNAMGGAFCYNKSIEKNQKGEDKPRYENPSFLAIGDSAIEQRLYEFAKKSKAKKL